MSFSVYKITWPSSPVFEPAIKRPNLEAEVNNNNIHYISLRGFQSLLEDAKTAADPYVALCSVMSRKDGYWTCFIELSPESHVECQLAYDVWDSVCFGEERDGEFRFIEVFEHDKSTGITDDKALVSIRISGDHREGEWLWINAGKKITGRQSKELAEEISRAMRIVTCYLADCSHVPSKLPGRDIEIRLPLRIKDGKGYYEPLFSLCNTQERLLSNIDILGTEFKMEYNQNIELYQRELNWIRQLPVKTIHDEILNGRDAAQKEFIQILKRYNPNRKGMKRIHESVINRCNWCFQQLVQKLYDKKKEPQALADYEWVYFNLLDSFELGNVSDIQKRYNSTIQKLRNHILLSADFSK